MTVGRDRCIQQLAELRQRYGVDPRLGCSLIAHRDLGFCAGCGAGSPYLDAELMGWRLLATVERGPAPQDWEKSIA